MDLGSNRGVKTSQWFSNEILRMEDINFVGESSYQNFTDLLAILAEQGVASGSTPDLVIAGCLLEHNNLLTCDLRTGAVVSFTGYYIASDGTWGFQASAGDLFGVYIFEDTSVAFDAGGAQDRIDIVEVRPIQEDYNAQSRQFKDPVTGAVTSAVVKTRTHYGFEFQIKKGTEGGSPSAPTHTAGWIKLAEVEVDAAASSIVQGDIKDVRESAGWTTEASHTLYKLIHEFGIGDNEIKDRHIGDDEIKDGHIDWGTGAGQVGAVDLPIADAGTRITATEVENALQEIVGAGRTTETIKANAADLAKRIKDSVVDLETLQDISETILGVLRYVKAEGNLWVYQNNWIPLLGLYGNTIFRVIADGNWDTITIWDENTAPSGIETAIILNNTVEMTGNETIGSLVLAGNGNFALPGGDINLFVNGALCIFENDQSWGVNIITLNLSCTAADITEIMGVGTVLPPLVLASGSTAKGMVLIGDLKVADDGANESFTLTTGKAINRRFDFYAQSILIAAGQVYIGGDAGSGKGWIKIYGGGAGYTITSTTENMGNMWLQDNGTVLTMQDNLTVEDLTLDVGTTLDKNGFALTVNGTTINNGTILD